ncbi:right-handed parallel beta-helix repeat-containing protein [Bradyrhizobium sp. WSM 1704]|uniref:right-handed parallel beta-helix repeat-containing protein n=1 Tax=Bradyrhizobium semiaridum TaxID=2821404 RepID=UPI001CE2C8F3|nr:right-handed parallel beta-helix repeat-containing protein [Bradyrhizobium semiaridum]MCA6122646.1 right-handed parallel beta-helix repeat-containing protein [Bradyrhizobium semiaridum]
MNLNAGAIAMRPILMLLAALLTAVALTVPWTSEARAQVYETFVAGGGNGGSDTNNCLFPTSACQSFSAAISKTKDGGSIRCASPGDFGFINITISVTIDCLAGGGSPNSGYIYIGAPGKTVVLRNIAVDGLHTGGTSIAIQSAANVFIENALIGGAATGLSDRRGGPGMLVIRNSSVVGNTGVGLQIAPSGGVLGVELDNVNAAYNKFGLAVGSGGRVMIKNSTFTGNSGAGITADPGAIVGVTATEISFNGTGVVASGTVTLSNSSINSNSTAISGPTRSLGNNLIFANPVEGTTPTIVSAR